MAPLLAFTTVQVERLTGLSARVLRYWEQTEVFRATHIDDTPGKAYRRLYTFRDVVGLRTLAMLRREHGVSLDELRRIGQYLSDQVETPWASLKFQLVDRHVVFVDPASGFPIVGEPLGQRVINFKLDDIARETESEARALLDRQDADVGRITRHRHVNHNAWTIAGTRIPTEAIWSFHADGFSTAMIQNEYPGLTAADVEAAIQHERALRAESVA